MVGLGIYFYILSTCEACMYSVLCGYVVTKYKWDLYLNLLPKYLVELFKWEMGNKCLVIGKGAHLGRSTSALAPPVFLS